MFSASRFLSLGVVCFLFATSTYGTIDCPAIQGNVDLILSIGPWKSASGFAVITTDLQLLAGTLEGSGPDPSTVRLQLSPPESLAIGEPKLVDFLLQETSLSCSDNLIEVNAPEDLGQERLLLLANQTISWVINPSTGSKEFLGSSAWPLTASWLSSDSRQLYALNGSAIFLGNYGKSTISLTSAYHLKYIDNFVEAQKDSAGDATQETWQVKKAFKWAEYFYVLTPETVYFFKGSIITESGAVPLFKIPYDQFFICPEPKEATKNGTGKEGKEEETSKGRVTRAHSDHLGSTVAQHVNVVAWVLGFLSLFCLFPGFVGALLYYFLIYSKKESLQGRVLSSGSVSFNGGLVHIHSKTQGEPKVKVPRSPKASPTKVKMASSKGLTASQLPGGLRVPTKVNVDVAKKQAAKLALKRASTGALKVKRENSKVKGASATKSK